MHNDLWHWRAVYTDDSFLDEHPDGDTTHAFADIAMERLAAFWLMPQDASLPHALIRVTDPRTRVIFFRRRTLTATQQELEQTDGLIGKLTNTLHVLGWQRTVNGRNVQSFTFIYPDGSMLVSDDRDAADG